MPSTNVKYKNSLLIICLLVITFIIYSAITPLLIEIIKYIFQKQNIDYARDYENFNYFTFRWWFMDANGTAFFFTWSFIFLVMFPYIMCYKFSSLNKLRFIHKFLFFFLLMLIAGLLLVPSAFVTNFFLTDKYPQKVLLLFSLSVIISPMVNFVLDRYLEVDRKIS